MVISHLPQLMVKSSPSEQSSTHSFLQPPLPQKRQMCSKNTKSISRDLNMIIESDDGSDDTINVINCGVDMEEHEHEVIE
jgi:hypothetical protein